jgi:hypothetical protein
LVPWGRARGARGSSALLAGWPDAVLAGIFVAVSLAWAAAGLWAFARFEHRARRLGLLDVTTAW